MLGRLVVTPVRASARFIGFCIIGLIGTIVEYGIFLGLTMVMRASSAVVVTHFIIPLTAFESSVVSNFMLSYYWVWKDRQGTVGKSFVKYNLSTCFSFLIRMVIFIAGTEGCRLEPAENLPAFAACYFLASAVATVSNFFLIDRAVFSNGKIGNNTAPDVQ